MAPVNRTLAWRRLAWLVALVVIVGLGPESTLARANGLTPRAGSEQSGHATVAAVMPRAATVGSVAREHRYFPETGHWVSHGFLAYWEQFGGLPVFGYPLTEEYRDPQTQLVTQWFERARFEWHPGAWPARYDVLLGRLGVELAQREGLLGTAPFHRIAAASDAHCTYFPETGHRLCFGFRAYWQAHGGLPIFGYPISEEFRDPRTGLTVQYFERQRLEWHPDNPPAWQVLGGRLGAQGLAASGIVSPPVPPPAFTASIDPVSEEQRSAMLATGSWRPGCPVPIADLRVLELSFWGLDGGVHVGQLMVNADVAAPVIEAFRGLFATEFPIRRMELVERFGADDEQSMLADNTSAYNCRGIPGSTAWSQHAYGRAVDLNPFENPEIRDGAVDPPSAARYVDRSLADPGMIHPGDAAVRAFAAIGWGWGGDWAALKDYMHFSATGT